MKDTTSFSDGTFAMLGTSMPTQKGLSLISSHPGCWVRLPQCETSEGGIRISTLSAPEALIMLFPVECSVVSFFNQTLYSKAFYCLGKYSLDPCFPDIPAHPTAVAACRHCLWVSCTRRVCRKWMHVLGLFGAQGSREVGFCCADPQDCCIYAVCDTYQGSQGCPLDAQ